MSMLDDGNAQAFRDEMRNQACEQRRLAGTAPPRQANDFQCSLPPSPSGSFSFRHRGAKLSILVASQANEAGTRLLGENAFSR
jgi:hypothetical protein